MHGVQHGDYAIWTCRLDIVSQLKGGQGEICMLKRPFGANSHESFGTTFDRCAGRCPLCFINGRQGRSNCRCSWTECIQVHVTDDLRAQGLARRICSPSMDGKWVMIAYRYELHFTSPSQPVLAEIEQSHASCSRGMTLGFLL